MSLNYKQSACHRSHAKNAVLRASIAWGTHVTAHFVDIEAVQAHRSSADCLEFLRFSGQMKVCNLMMAVWNTSVQS